MGVRFSTGVSEVAVTDRSLLLLLQARKNKITGIKIKTLLSIIILALLSKDYAGLTLFLFVTVK